MVRGRITRSTKALRDAIAEDLGKASARLRFAVINSVARSGIRTDSEETRVRWILDLRRYHFLENRNVGKTTADELQAILEKHGVAEYYCEKKPKNYRRVTDEEALAYLVRIVRHRNMIDVDLLLAAAVKRINEERS